MDRHWSNPDDWGYFMGVPINEVPWQFSLGLILFIAIFSALFASIVVVTTRWAIRYLSMRKCRRDCRSVVRARDTIE